MILPGLIMVIASLALMEHIMDRLPSLDLQKLTVASSLFWTGVFAVSIGLLMNAGRAFQGLMAG